MADSLFIVALGGSVLGTFLLITHPMQRLLVGFFALVNRKDIMHRPVPDWDRLYKIQRLYVRKALNTTSIRFERDRIVAIFYFVIILALVLTAVLGGSIGRIFGIQNPDFVRPSALGVLIALIIIFYIFLSETKKFRSRVVIVAIYLQEVGTHSLNIRSMDTYLDQVGRAIEVNDWVTGAEWAQQMLAYVRTQDPTSFVMDEKSATDSH
ncbi:MAG: hypothetical protein ACE5KA_09220 [Nitrososphaerales archaeon]